MATKDIPVSEDVYETLVRLKEDDEDFSDVIRRLSHEYSDVTEFSGAFPEIGDVADELEAEREAFRTREVGEL